MDLANENIAGSIAFKFWKELRCVGRILFIARRLHATSHVRFFNIVYSGRIMICSSALCVKNYIDYSSSRSPSVRVYVVYFHTFFHVDFCSLGSLRGLLRSSLESFGRYQTHPIQPSRRDSFVPALDDGRWGNPSIGLTLINSTHCILCRGWTRNLRHRFMF